MSISSGAHIDYNLFFISALHVLNLSDVYGGEAAPAHANNVQCNGNEEQLVDCLRVSLNGSSSCAAYMGPAGVVCQGQTMKLMKV